MSFPLSVTSFQGVQNGSVFRVSPKFGRDAIFERNDRFESLNAEDQRQIKILEKLLASGKRDVAEIAEKSAFFYDAHGRIRGKSAVALALQAAQSEYAFFSTDPKANAFDRALAGVKLANAMLAADVDCENAFALLDDSLKAVEQSGWNLEKSAISPILVHGFYNRGSYFMNNVLYKESVRNVGPLEANLSDAGHEGLLLVLGRNLDIDGVSLKLEEGLPYLEKAVELARRIGAQDKISVAEYLVAQGEACHFLSHLKATPFGTDPVFNRRSLDAFKEALEEVTSVESGANERHLKLTEKLVEVKIDHLCSERHVDNGTPFCAAGPVMGAEYILGREAEGVRRAPDTHYEQMDRRLQDGPPSLPLVMELMLDRLRGAFERNKTGKNPWKS